MKKQSELTPFTRRVVTVLAKVPRGRVASYKQIAALVGRPNAVRGVVWILNSCSKKHRLPWHRIVSAQGRVAFKPLTYKFRLQRQLLRQEGVEVGDLGEIDLARFQWRRAKA